MLPPHHPAAAAAAAAHSVTVTAKSPFAAAVVTVKLFKT